MIFEIFSAFVSASYFSVYPCSAAKYIQIKESCKCLFYDCLPFNSQMFIELFGSRPIFRPEFIRHIRWLSLCARMFFHFLTILVPGGFISFWHPASAAASQNPSCAEWPPPDFRTIPGRTWRHLSERPPSRSDSRRGWAYYKKKTSGARLRSQ